MIAALVALALLRSIAFPPQASRSVIPEGTGAQRLELDGETVVFAGERVNLLRLHDGAGREVPYLVMETDSRTSGRRPTPARR